MAGGNFKKFDSEGLLSSALKWLSSRLNTSLEVKKKTTVTIIVNGKKQTRETNSDLNEQMIQELASQLNLPAPAVQAMTAFTLATHSSDGTTTVQQTQRVTQPLMKVVCPKCHRTVAETQRCLYCGQQLTQTATVKDKVNDVDKKFLEADVKQETEIKDQEQQKVQDSFQDRLKNL